MLNFTDEKLFSLCKYYGGQALHWRRKFIGLLPEVNRRRLFEKKGFGSIFEFAKKLAGLSEEQVRVTLNIEKRLEVVPKLQELLTSGAVSVNKLARVVSIASTENEEFLVNQVQLLPKSAVETLVRDERKLREMCNENGLFERQVDGKSLPGQTCGVGVTSPGLGNSMELQSCLKGSDLGLSAEITERLLELKRKGIDVNAVLGELLDARELEIAREKEQIAEELLSSGVSFPTRSGIQGDDTVMVSQSNHMILRPPPQRGRQAQGDSVSRYIPRKIKKLLKKEYGGKCSIQTCEKPSENLHHTQRFAISRNHDPHFLAPLCGDHHAIAHAVDVRVQEVRRMSV